MEPDTDTPDESGDSAPERAELAADKPRRGRPPGSTNKPRLITEAMATAGAKQIARLFYLFARGVSRLFDGSLEPMTDTQLDEGIEHIKPFILKFAWMVYVLMAVGFPTWLITTAIENFKPKPPPPAKKDEPAEGATVHALPARSTEASH